MHITEMILLGLALAMDCFTVSITSGAIVQKVRVHPMAAMVFLFGLFQGGMVVIGWYVSNLFSYILEPVDHWVAFGLLAFIGIKMIKDGRQDNDETPRFNPLSYKVILTLAVATSIDAMAVGVSMAFIQLNTWNAICMPVAIIAVISLLLTLCGLAIGILIGRKIPFPTAPIGGVILIGIGIKIIIEHLS